MTRGSMIALNLLEQELGIDDTQNMNLDEFLESIVGKDQLKELDDEVKSSDFQFYRIVSCYISEMWWLATKCC